MASRMDKYNTVSNDVARVSSNEKLYSEKTNKTPITAVSNPNEINISNLSNNSSSRAEYKRTKHVNELIKNDEDKNIDEAIKEDLLFEDTFDEKDFNLNAHLERAKKNNEEVMQKYHKLTETILSGMNFIDENTYKTKLTDERKSELIKSLNNLNNEESKNNKVTTKNEPEVIEEAELFADLMGGDDTIVIPPINIENNSSSKTVTKPIYLEDSFDDTIDISNEMKIQDTSFYSKSISFKQSDFDNSKKGKNKVNVILSIILALIMLTILGICIYILFQIINA